MCWRDGGLYCDWLISNVNVIKKLDFQYLLCIKTFPIFATKLQVCTPNREYSCPPTCASTAAVSTVYLICVAKKKCIILYTLAQKIILNLN